MKESGKRIEEVMNHFGLNKNSFSVAIGMTSNVTIGRILKENRDPHPSTLKKIVNKFPQINYDWLLTGEGEMLKSAQATPVSEKTGSLPLIPFDYIAGFGEDNAGIELNRCERYIIPEFQNIGAEFLVRVGGSSMYPKYSSGDILACKKIPKEDITFFQWGKVYVIDSAQGQLIKRVFENKEEEDKIWLVSDNAEKYPRFTVLKSEIRSLSIVLGVVRME